MVTERGTVHLLDMPPSAYTWPPPRRRPAVQSPGSNENGSSAVSMASNALSSAYGAARPLISAHRRSSSSTQANPTIMNHASYGGKVIAAGISHSLGNAGTAINHLRHTGENRVSLPLGSMTTFGLSCVTWVTGRKYHSLFAIGEGMVRTFPSKSRKAMTHSKEKSRFPRGNRYKDFKLKNLPDDVIAPSIKKIIDRDDDLDLTNQELEGGHTMVLAPQPRLDPADLSPESSIPQAEIESSAPYQPFHTDRRIGLYEYGGEQFESGLHAVSQQLDAATLADKPKHGKKRRAEPPSKRVWAFGQPIDAVKIDVGHPWIEEDPGHTNVDDHRALPVSAMERVLQVGDNDEQIVVTTRRRRGGGNRHADGGDEDEFFEDGLEIIDFADQRV